MFENSVEYDVSKTRGCHTGIFDSQLLNDFYMLYKVSTQHLCTE